MMSQTPKVSVVVLSYNHEKYIRQALDSILAQKTDFAFEVLVGDDCSQDGTRLILEEYAERYPDIMRPFLREKNLGPTRNLYETLKEARGEYLASCEGDDFWTDENKLQRQSDFLDAHPEFVGCVHPVGVVGEDGAPLKTKKLQWVSSSANRVFTLRSFRGIMVPGHGASMMKRNLFDIPDFDGELICRADRNIADRTIALLWLERGDFYMMDGEMACYRKVDHGSNLTSRLYKTSRDRVSYDYEYTLTLERYALSRGLDAGFDYHKRELFVKAVLFAVKQRDREYLSTAGRILKKSGHPLRYILGFIPMLISLIRRSV